MELRTYKAATLLFLGVLVVLVITGALSAHALYVKDLPYTDNDLIRQHQFSRLASSASVDVVILGDSSAGNAIDEELFSEVTGRNTLNLALTGSFGLAGTYNMLRHAHKRGIDTAIIVHTPDIWHRNVSVQGYIDTLEDLPAEDANALVSSGYQAQIFQRTLNPREIGWYVQRRVLGPPEREMGRQFFVQRDERFSNGALHVKETEVIPLGVSDSKVRFLHKIDDFCGTEQIECVLLHGPLHEGVAEMSADVFNSVEPKLRALEHVRFIDRRFTYPASSMGDTIDHVAPSARNKVTEDYAEAVREFLPREDSIDASAIEATRESIESLRDVSTRGIVPPTTTPAAVAFAK